MSKLDEFAMGTVLQRVRKKMTTFRCQNFEKHQAVRWLPSDPLTGAAPRCPECGKIMEPSPPGDPNPFNPVNPLVEGFGPKDPRGLP
jgi:hypothetical protein